MRYSRIDFKEQEKNILYEKYLNSIIKIAERGLDIELIKYEEASSGEGLHGNFYSASLPFKDFISYICLAYKHTKQKKFFDKIKDLMLHYAKYDKWNGNFCGNSELNNAHFCRAMAIGFYTIQNELDEEDCKTIAEGTLQNGIMPIMKDWVLKGTRIHALDTMGHNWWMVCVASAGAALVSMNKYIEESDSLIKAAIEACERWFKYEGNFINSKPPSYADGAFYESVSYLDFALQDYYVFKYFYEIEYNKKIFDDDLYLLGYSEFFVHTFIPLSKGNEFLLIGDTSIMKMMRTALWMLGMGMKNPELLWYVKQWEDRETDVLDIMFFEKIHLSEGMIPEKKSIIYPKIGWSIMRNSFAKDSAVLAVKCGDTWNHAHADAGSFIFYNHGNSIVYDSGGCAYSLPDYVNYYFTSHAHNVVLFNGNGQDERDRLDHTRMRGNVCNLRDYGNVKYVLADATGPMSRYFRHHLRHFVWLDDFVLIYDDIEAYEPGEISYLLHIDENFGNEFEMLTSAILEKKIGKKHKQPDVDVAYDIYKIKTDNEGRCKIFSVLKLKDNVEVNFYVENEVVFIGDGNWNVSINLLSDGRIMHANCITQMKQLTTDAIMVCQKNNSYFIVNGSMLRKNGESIYDELERHTVLVEHKID